MVTTHSPVPGIDVLTSSVAIPGFGLVPVNSFVLHGSEPVLVDTGTIVERDGYLTAMQSAIDLDEVRWIWLTHTDFDHIGNLHRLLQDHAQIRVITTFLGVGIMGLFEGLPMDRVHLVNPGQSISVGDRVLKALKPPVFDNPATTGFVDSSTGTLFSSDCFGALLQELPEHAADLTPGALRDGQVLWATVDSPWLHKVDRDTFARELASIASLSPTMILSSHLPPASGAMTEQMLSSLAAVPDAVPFVGPDQAALEQMLAEMTGTPPR